MLMETIHGNLWVVLVTKIIYIKQLKTRIVALKTFNRFTPVAPDIYIYIYMHTPNADDTGENDVRGK